MPFPYLVFEGKKCDIGLQDVTFFDVVIHESMGWFSPTFVRKGEEGPVFSNYTNPFHSGMPGE
jgi:hypothetical protein